MASHEHYLLAILIHNAKALVDGRANLLCTKVTLQLQQKNYDHIIVRVLFILIFALLVKYKANRCLRSTHRGVIMEHYGAKLATVEFGLQGGQARNMVSQFLKCPLLISEPQGTRTAQSRVRGGRRTLKEHSDRLYRFLPVPKYRNRTSFYTHLCILAIGGNCSPHRWYRSRGIMGRGMHTGENFHAQHLQTRSNALQPIAKTKTIKYAKCIVCGIY